MHLDCSLICAACGEEALAGTAPRRRAVPRGRETPMKKAPGTCPWGFVSMTDGGGLSRAGGATCPGRQGHQDSTLGPYGGGCRDVLCDSKVGECRCVLGTGGPLRRQRKDPKDRPLRPLGRTDRQTKETKFVLSRPSDPGHKKPAISAGAEIASSD